MADKDGQSIDVLNCPMRSRRGSCVCEHCMICGFGKHMAVHGPLYGAPVGSPPYSHEYVPALTKRQHRVQREVLRSLGR
jgi:hypothetical protein